MRISVKESITLFDFLQKNYPQTPKTRLKKWLQNGLVKYNGKVTTLYSQLLKTDGIVEIETHSGDKQMERLELPFTVLFEDQYFVAIDKPAGIASVSVDNSPNVYKIVTLCLKKQSKGAVKAYVLHRLDKEVSGVLLFAKSEKIMTAIKDAWQENEKYYYALVEGAPKEPQGTIESWLRENNRMMVYSSSEPKDAKYAITHYRTLKTFDSTTLLEVELETGRKNQIRVHLSDIGCPIVGDWKYGAKKDFIRRVRLHAYSLSFTHPETKERIKIESPLPKDFLVLKNHNESYKESWMV
jgi:23S rRNA pseudouridine1911/1915/1917 synthase